MGAAMLSGAECWAAPAVFRHQRAAQYCVCGWGASLSKAPGAVISHCKTQLTPDVLFYYY